MTDLPPELTWGAWVPLHGISRNPTIPRTPGVYRVRRTGRVDLDYVGQTGRSLRERLGALSRCHSDTMPYRDPHTAAPALWALRHSTGCEFEASAMTTAGDPLLRLGREALEIGLHRQTHGASPTVQFGRVPVGYRASSPNNARLVAAGNRFRGGPYSGPTLAEHRAGTSPVGRLTPDPHAPSWCGHQWSPWRPLHDVSRDLTTPATGLYRIRGDADRALLYVGQGVLPARPRAHLAKISKVGHRQGVLFGSQRRLEVSWVAGPQWPSNHLLELENDLIAAHVLHLDYAPIAQFLG